MNKGIRVYRRVVGYTPGEQYNVWHEIDTSGVDTPEIVYPLNFAEALERVVKAARRYRNASHAGSLMDIADARSEVVNALAALDALEKEE